MLVDSVPIIHEAVELVVLEPGDPWYSFSNMSSRFYFGFVGACIGAVLFALPGAVAGQEGKAGPGTLQKQRSSRTAEECFPACRRNYVCHPEKLECVSVCNPACDDHEVCTEDAACIPDGRFNDPEREDLGDERFRVVLLGRFGVLGKLTLGVRDFMGDVEESFRPEKPTAGFELRFEKPVRRYFSFGGLLSSYFIRPGQSGYDFAADFAPFIKPRVPFRVGKREGEVYLAVHFGPSVLALRNISAVGATRLGHAGFNVGASPGIQLFFSKSVALVFEIGYAYSWFRISDQGEDASLRKLTLGQLTLRPGFAFAF